MGTRRRSNGRKRPADLIKPLGDHEAALRLLKEGTPVLHHLAENEPHALGSGLEVLENGIGKPWAEVRQHLEHALAGSSLTVEEFAAEFCVELDPVMRHGVPHSKRSDGTLTRPTGWGMNLYVDPVSGLLLNWNN
jgi:hypothetical protein